MNPQRFAQANTVLGPPAGWTEKQCAPVHAYVGEGRVITCWHPNEAERVKIAMGQPVWLCLIGPTMQPALVTADFPFTTQVDVASQVAL